MTGKSRLWELIVLDSYVVQDMRMGMEAKLSQNPGLAIASNCGDLTTIASASHQKSGDITTPASDSEGPLQGII